MHDQAATLRTMASASDVANLRKNCMVNTRHCRWVAVTGGKGGVGKSNLTVNLSLELGLQGNKVGLLDADFTLANGDLIGGADETLDFMLIDTAACTADSLSDITASASEVIVVATPGSKSIVDAYTTIKIILRRAPGKPVSIIVNDMLGVRDAEQVYRTISAVVNEFLDHRIHFLGMIPHDPQVQAAIRKQVPVVKYAPNSPASRAIRLIAKRLHDQGRPEPDYNQVRSFRDQLAQN